LRRRLPPLRSLYRPAAALGAAAFAVVAYTYLTLPDVRPLLDTNPTTTAFMELRAEAAADDGRRIRKVHRWVPYSRISPHLKRAVLVAEDSAFWDHEGIDVEQIRKAIEIAMERGGAIRGASTLTQQLAKNLYLSPSRNPLRKLKELIITRRLETTLPKARIFEIYLNVVEWGDGIWGADAAARTYFGVPPSALTREQAALLAGALINPIVYSPARPPARLRRRQSMILARMGSVEPPVAVTNVGPSPELPDPAVEEPFEGVPSPSSPQPEEDAVPAPEPPPDRPPVPQPFPTPPATTEPG
jgi:monofunctional glycosyltransferase